MEKKIPPVVMVKAYQDFVIKAVEKNGGVMSESDLDALILAKFKRHWSATDKSHWGGRGWFQKSKWKQNVVSAKASLDRTGRVISFKANGIKWRVSLGGHYETIIYALMSRELRGKKWKRSYRALKQPPQRYIVPK